jgi:NAD(P)-dependent dehydrogenase (short-subunit alcohol dehydrogenase family)
MVGFLSSGTPQRVLITGGEAGIGTAIAERCRQDGYSPIVIDRAQTEDGKGIVADLSDREQTARALEQALAGGSITRLVNNVGVVVPREAETQSLNSLDLAVSLNLRCALQCLQALLPGMREAGFGRIVNMSSCAALGKELRTAYSATKAGLIGMTRVWALELGGLGSRPTRSTPDRYVPSCSIEPTRRTRRARRPSSMPCRFSAWELPRTLPVLSPTSSTSAAASRRDRSFMSAAA